MSSGFISKAAFTVAALACFYLPQLSAPASAQWASPQPASAFTIPTSQIIHPADLNRLLQTHDAEKPLILQVGSRMMFAQAHIPGSEYAGPGSEAEGLEQLRARVSSLARSRFIVIYCGCCPWNHCPNVGPAYNVLHEMGFTRVKVLFLADNFGADWVSKGFPVQSGQ
ncbi:MAG: rhodanese-like domain-containing protein [Terracidiphilus sp.]